MVSTNSGSSPRYTEVLIEWYVDSAGSTFIGFTNWTIPPGIFYMNKVPCVSRYYRVRVIPVGLTGTGSILFLVYGTNGDQENQLTQNTAQPLKYANVSLGANVINTSGVFGPFGGVVQATVDDNVNNKWTFWMEYYDEQSQAWTQFITWHGTDKGQSFADTVYLPYAPVRFNIRNDDTVTHTFIVSVIAP